MTEEKSTLEIIAPTVEEAVERGLDQLGLPRDAVDVEILDTGSRGVFGLGGRQARVRLTFGFSKTEAAEMRRDVEEELFATGAPPKTALTLDEEDRSLKLTTMVVRDLLERMKVRAKVSASYLQPADPKEAPTVMVDIQGNDLSILIGRRSETINALQYITNLIVGKELGRWVPVLIDVQGYRTRRERQLRAMAHRLAEQVVQTGRPQVLEPMPANERRTIHLELRDHPLVKTESVGEDPNRKVTILLKK
ncbi:MAG: KH domain-containing protein [Anaerolineae bacterium]|nr:KH domain-containing protein [Anaerolineae bacterium]